MTEKLPGDVYRVVELNKNKKSRFATTYEEKDDESEVDQDDESEVNQDEEGEVETREGTVEVLGRPIRKRRPLAGLGIMYYYNC